MKHIFPPPIVDYRRMSRNLPVDSQIAAALKMLRYRAGRSLKELAPTVGVTQQVMSRWENATAAVPHQRLPLYLKAVGATNEDLEREVSMLAEAGEAYIPQARTPVVVDQPVAGLESVAVNDESMSPWCEPGERVWFQRGQHPKRLEGCVVELKDGRVFIRQFMRERDGFFFFQRINPESVDQFLHSEVAALHRIAYRGG